MDAEAVTDGLTFGALREANVQRLPTFRNRHGGLAHTKADGSDWSPAQWLQAVVGEIGEYANLRKKFERGDVSQEEFQREAADELADVVTYLDILAYQLNINLGRAVVDKFNRVSKRVGSPVQIFDDNWHAPNPELTERLRSVDEWFGTNAPGESAHRQAIYAAICALGGEV